MSSQLYLWVMSYILYMPIRSDLVAAQLQNSSLIVGTLTINGAAPIAQTDDQFICANIDYGRAASLLTVDLNNALLQTAVKAFTPLKFRLGGTLQDDVVFETPGQTEPCKQFVKNTSHAFGLNPICLPMARWDQINTFLKDTGSVAIFGLNALTGKTISNGQALGPWDSTNAEALISYTATSNYSIVGWELGNELTGNGTEELVAADQYVDDATTLYNLIQDIYKEQETKPLVVAPGGVFNAPWFTEFAQKTTNTVQAISHHVYNLGSGRNPKLINKMTDPWSLHLEAHIFANLRDIIKQSGTSAVAWVSEAGGALYGGQDNVTNAFAMAFWYVDQLGLSATYDTKTYCRQTLVGGNYSLLSRDFIPNPDFYCGLLWHRIMGTKVLSTSFNSTTTGLDRVHTYAHCSKQRQGVVLVILNLDGERTIQANVSIEGGSINATRTNRRIMNTDATREEYHFSAPNGDLHSRVALLNGNPLNVTASGEIPDLEPVMNNAADPIIVDPHTVVFVDFPSVDIPACH